MIEFSAVAPLLSLEDLEELSGVHLLAQIRRAIRELGCGGRPVVLLDDVDHADDASATVLGQLIRAGEITFVGTLRSSAKTPPWLGDLVQRRVISTKVIGGLDRSSCDAIVACRLGEAITIEVLDALWSLSGGNPLVVIELTEGAVSSGSLKTIDGEWQLVSALPVTAMLADQIDAGLNTLSAAARDALDLVAMSERCELAVLEQLVETQALTELERASLITVEDSGSRTTVTVADPLVRETCKQQLPTTRRRALARTLASAVAATGSRRDGDALRIADWALQSGQHSEPRVLVIAASEALKRGDLVTANRMIGAAIDAGAGFRAYLVAAQIRAAQRSWADAEVAAMTASSLAVDDDELAEAAVVHSRLLAGGGGTLSEAAEIILAAADRVSFGAAQERLEVEHARLGVIEGDLEEALELAARDGQSATRALALERLALSAHVHVVAGRFRSAVELIDARSGAAQKSTEFGIESDEPLAVLVAANRCEALLMSGDVAAASMAVAQALDGSEVTLAASSRGIWLYVQARVSALTGSASLALGHIVSSVEALAGSDAMAWRGRATSMWALLAAQAGDTDQCRAALGQLHDDVGASAYVPASIATRARAWLAANDGDYDVAVAQLGEAATRSVQSGHLQVAAEAAFDAVRLGGAGTVNKLLRRLAEGCESDLITEWADHAQATVDQDLSRLDELSLIYAERGLVVFAAEVALQAGGALDRADKEGGGRFRVRARTLLSEDDTAAPAASVATSVPNQKRVLTRRQEQIARLAVDRSNSEIAAELSISIRTVENHLHTAFQRLGVHSRSDLANVFALSRVN